MICVIYKARFSRLGLCVAKVGAKPSTKETFMRSLKNPNVLFATLCGIISVSLGVFCWFEYQKNTEVKTVSIGDGVEVECMGFVHYAANPQSGFVSNQFSSTYDEDVNAWNKGGTTHRARFVVKNTGETPKKVSITSFSGWEVPFSADPLLEPGQTFEFVIKPVDGHHWYCWVNTELPEKNEKK